MFWQKALLDVMKKRVKNGTMRALINQLYREKKNGFYVHAKGEIKDLTIVSKYLARYAGRPAIAESRIIGYDGEFVTIKYVPHGEAKEVEEVLPVVEFIGRLLIHIPESHFKMMRNYGIYARNSKKAKRIERYFMPKQKYEKLRRLKTWQMRLMLDYGKNPLKCPCGSLMKFSDIVVPEKRKRERDRWQGRYAG